MQIVVGQKYIILRAVPWNDKSIAAAIMVEYDVAGTQPSKDNADISWWLAIDWIQPCLSRPLPQANALSPMEQNCHRQLCLGLEALAHSNMV